MTMRKYIVRSVHKVDNPCKCGCRSHSEGGGPCTAWNATKRALCGCAAFDPADVAERELPADVMDADTPDVKAIAKALREARILSSGGRLSHVVRGKHGRLTCFPQAGAWHSYIIRLAPSELTASVALRTEATRAGWPTRFATDLARDANEIAGMLPREPFAWCLRADGTHIARARAPHSTALTMRMVADTFGAESCRFYVWTGAVLCPVPTADAADKRLAEIAGQRFAVKPRRACTLMPCSVATPEAARTLAAEWETRYGEEFITSDTWTA